MRFTAISLLGKSSFRQIFVIFLTFRYLKVETFNSTPLSATNANKLYIYQQPLKRAPLDKKFQHFSQLEKATSLPG